MNRMDRLFGLVVLLQARKRLRADDLAAEFGVSRRTIYRDIFALNEAGVPIVSLPGEGYELMEGYFLPPLVFTAAEASALVLGARLLQKQAAGRIARDGGQATAKLSAALPPRIREEVDGLAGVIDFFSESARFDLDDPRLMTLQQAIREQRVVHLRYHTRERDQLTERDVEPSRLTYGGGAWYLEGYCRLRGGPRSFRLERIEALTLQPDRFERRPSLSDPADGPSILVRVCVDGHAVRWVRERQHYGFVSEERDSSDPQASAIMSYQVRAMSEIVPWLRGWGAAIEVLSPPELRSAMREEARRIIERLA